MSNIKVPDTVGGVPCATDRIAGEDYQWIKLDKGAPGVSEPVNDANPLPVAGPLTDAELRVTPVPVSGTVELGAAALAALETITVASVTAAIPAGDNNIGNVDLASPIPAGTNNIGTVELSAAVLAALETITVAAITAALPAGNNNIGDVDLASAIPAGANNIGTVELSAAALAALETITVAAITAALPAGNNNIGDVDIASVPTLTKGTQGATGLTTQDLKDAGRSQVLLFWDYINAAAGTTALTNFTTGTRAAAALGAATNLQVSANKTLRIQAVHISIAATSATRPAFRCQIRQAASVLNSSPIIWESKHAMEQIGTLAADIPGHTYVFPIPDGLEVAAGQQISFTILAAAAHGKAAMTIIGYEY